MPISSLPKSMSQAKKTKNKRQFLSHSISMMIQKTLLTPNGKSSFPNEKSKNCVKPSKESAKIDFADISP